MEERIICVEEQRILITSLTCPQPKERQMELLNSANAMVALADAIQLSLAVMAGMFAIVLGWSSARER
jgi:hypothetical protein